MKQLDASGAQATQVAAFEAIAAHYDATFSDRPIGRVLRRAVWRRLDLAVAPGMRVLDLGCGTGVDAQHLAERGLSVLGIDASAAMVRVAERRIAAAGLADRAFFRALPIEGLAVLGSGSSLGSVDLRSSADPASPDPALDLGLGLPFDLALSNFGALNCVADLGRFARDLAGLLRPGGIFIAVIMGPRCAWETAWHLLRGDRRRALRRWGGEGMADLGAGSFPVYYPSPRDFALALGPDFAIRDLRALNALLPPSGVAERLVARPRVLDALARADRALAKRRVAVGLADHYLVEVVRF